MGPGSLRALIVEDDQYLADILKMKLEGLGHEGTIARNQEEAQRFLDAERFDLALLDLQLPVDDDDADPNIQVGFDILARIVEPDGPPFPVYVMTAHGDGVPTAVRAMRGGAEDFIVKPFSGVDERLEGMVRAVQNGACRTVGRPPRKATEHCLIFDELSVYVDGIRFQRGIVEILRLLAAKAYGDAGLRPGGGPDAGELTSGDIAGHLGRTKDAIRAVVVRFRKRFADEIQKRGGAVRDDEIIADTRAWQGYSLNPAVVLRQFSPGSRVSA